MAEIYLIRHGEAENNIKNIFGEDSELTEKGERQAREIAEYLKDFEFDVIYHSPKKRAVKTANIIAELINGIELIEIPEITEMDYGILEGLSIDDVNKRFPGLFKERAENKYYWKFVNRNNKQALKEHDEDEIKFKPRDEKWHEEMKKESAIIFESLKKKGLVV